MLTIVNARKAASNEWDDMCKSSESGTYFHTSEWAEVWKSYTNGNIAPDPKVITFSDEKKVILPVMRQNYYNGIIKRYALTGPSFISKYGNWLTNDRLSKDHISLITSFVIEKYKNLTWQLNPFDDDSNNVTVNSKYAQRFPHTTYMVNLTQDEETIYSKMKSSCRNHIKQGIKNKLVVSEGTDIEHWKQYYNIYRDTIKRWGVKTPYVLGWKLFELLFKRNNPIIKLWLVWYNEIPIAGSINFYSHEKIIGWHMASLTEYRKLRPNHLLEYTMIKDGINKNYRWYDLGTDGGNKGLENFKRSFGPEKVMCDKIIKWSPLIYCSKYMIGYLRRN